MHISHREVIIPFQGISNYAPEKQLVLNAKPQGCSFTNLRISIQAGELQNNSILFLKFKVLDLFSVIFSNLQMLKDGSKKPRYTQGAKIYVFM